MLEINYQKKYDKPIILYNNVICRTIVNQETNKITIIEDFKTENIQNDIKETIVKILNKNWDYVSYKEGQKHMDVLVGSEIFFRSFYEDELWLHPKNKYIDITKHKYYDKIPYHDIWG